MTAVAHHNVTMIRRVAVALGPLRQRVVFVGGATAGLLISDPAGAGFRPTKDVDLIVEVTSTIFYATVLRDELVRLGFKEDTSKGAPLCRWLFEDLIVDVMPTAGSVLGFSNRWYVVAMETATGLDLPAGPRVRIVTAPAFLATKLDAFEDRGQGDYQASHDLEDLIAVVDGRPEVVEETATADPNMTAYITATLRRLLADEAFVAALPGHLPPDRASQDRLPLLIERLERLAQHQLGLDRSEEQK
jgi:hypothetical protein